MIELNGKVVKPTRFPDKTTQVWKLDNLNFSLKDTNEVWWWFEQEHELFHLLQLNDLMRHRKSMSRSNLYIPYLPYARQDKEVSNDTTFSLWSFIRVLGLMCWHNIYVFDAHSRKHQDFVDYENIEPNLDFVDDYDLIIFPDSGACQRYKHLLTNNGLVWKKPMLIGNKIRDQKTGWITHYDLYGGKPAKSARIIVIDDLCDGGATFNILAKSLDVDNKPDLYVSHGIFSKGVKELLENYNKIITTDSFFHNVDRKKAAQQCPHWKDRLLAEQCGRMEIKSVKELMNV